MGDTCKSGFTLSSENWGFSFVLDYAGVCSSAYGENAAGEHFDLAKVQMRLSNVLILPQCRDRLGRSSHTDSFIYIEGVILLALLTKDSVRRTTSVRPWSMEFIITQCTQAIFQI